MVHIHLFTDNFKTKYDSILRQGIQKTGELYGYTLNVIKNIPQRIQNQDRALVIILLTNHLFFFAMNAMLNRWENPENPNENFSRKMIKHLKINLGIACTTLGLNLFLSYLTRYSLSKQTLALLMTGMVAMRWISQQLSFTKSKRTIPQHAPYRFETSPQKPSSSGAEKLFTQTPHSKCLEVPHATLPPSPGSPPMVSQKPSMLTPEQQKNWESTPWREKLRVANSAQKIGENWRKKVAAKKGNSPIPPEAPPLSDIPEAPIMMERNFENEPPEPRIKLPGMAGYVNNLDKMTPAELEKEIREIEAYIAEMKKVLKGIQTLIHEEERLQEAIKDQRAELIKMNKGIEEEEKMIVILSRSSPVSHLQLVVSTEQTKPMPFYSKERFEQINQKLKEKSLPSLPLKYTKKHQLDICQEKLTKLKSNKKQLEMVVQLDEEHFSRIRTMKNQDIPFKDFKEVYTLKEQQLDKWALAITRRRQQLKPPKNSSPTVVTKDPMQLLMKENPELELEAYVDLQQNQMSAILVKFDGYKNRLIAGK